MVVDGCSVGNELVLVSRPRSDVVGTPSSPSRARDQRVSEPVLALKLLDGTEAVLRTSCDDEGPIRPPLRPLRRDDDGAAVIVSKHRWPDTALAEPEGDTAAVALANIACDRQGAKHQGLVAAFPAQTGPNLGFGCAACVSLVSRSTVWAKVPGQ